jgi:hypothetical protein
LEFRSLYPSNSIRKLTNERFESCVVEPASKAETPSVSDGKHTPLNVVRESSGSLLLTLTDEPKLIGVVAGQKVAVSADPRRIRIMRWRPERMAVDRKPIAHLRFGRTCFRANDKSGITEGESGSTSALCLLRDKTRGLVGG